MRFIVSAPSIIASFGWSHDEVRSYLWLNGTSEWDDVSYDNRYVLLEGRTYNHNITKMMYDASLADKCQSSLFLTIYICSRLTEPLVDTRRSCRGGCIATTPVLRAIKDNQKNCYQQRGNPRTYLL
uniref:Uncharacterized protein MLCB1913.15 n=1 Tax=Mycobacterium leprae TaxID=1769 RepID=O53123_MYCLR|nr:hypothetical protein MLCB1913.15 [Mycobacterium leprae]